MISSVADLNFSWFDNVETVGLSSGASAPDILVEGVQKAICEKFPDILVENSVTLVENLPKELQEP